MSAKIYIAIAYSSPLPESLKVEMKSPYDNIIIQYNIQ